MPDTLYDWLQDAARQHHVQATFHRQLVREDGGWYYVPVHIADVLDAYDKASVLQDIENSWNDQEPTPDHQVLLIPSAK